MCGGVQAGQVGCAWQRGLGSWWGKHGKGRGRGRGQVCGGEQVAMGEGGEGHGHTAKGNKRIKATRPPVPVPSTVTNFE